MNNNENRTPNKPTMDVKEVAEQLGIGKDLAYAICDGKRFPVKKLGRRTIVIRRSFEEWLFDGKVYSVMQMGG